MMQWHPMMQQMNPMADFSNTMNKVFHAWENAAEKTLDVQNDFVSHLVPVEKTEASKIRKPRSKAKKTTATNVTKHKAAA